MRVVTFKIDEDMLEKLDTIARLKGMNRSEAIRRAIDRFIREEWDKLNVEPKVIKIYS